MEDLRKRFTFQVITQGTLSVDTFFFMRYTHVALDTVKKYFNANCIHCIRHLLQNKPVLFFSSGLLVAFLHLKQLQKGNGKINWIMFYVHRFCR